MSKDSWSDDNGSRWIRVSLGGGQVVVDLEDARSYRYSCGLREYLDRTDEQPMDCRHLRDCVEEEFPGQVAAEISAEVARLSAAEGRGGA